MENMKAGFFLKCDFFLLVMVTKNDNSLGKRKEKEKDCLEIICIQYIQCILLCVRGIAVAEDIL